MNALSMSKWTRIYTFQLSSGSHVCCKRIQTKRLFVTWLVTLLLIICPSSYKARLNNLIGTANICPQIISLQWNNARPNFPTKKIVGGAKFGLVSRLGCPFTKCYKNLNKFIMAFWDVLSNIDTVC